jgi:hypothetical protein
VGVSYEEFLESKLQLADGGGFAPLEIPDYLFPFQRTLTEWAIRQGRAGLFADCGLGKTPMELVWADNVHRFTGKPVLLVTPLAVGFQVVREAEKFGVEAAISRNGSVAGPITVTNYERLEKFHSDDFGGVVCDESSAIKSFDGVRRAIVTEFLRRVPYRLLGTATAAPNDYIELGTASEALGQLGFMDMLGRFFVNDQRTADVRGRFQRRIFGDHKVVQGPEKGWRFKGHAEDPFWRWVASWARACRKPSDMGFSDDGFVLPPLVHELHSVSARTLRDGELFDMPALGLDEEREELRRTISERCEAAAECAQGNESTVVWCNLNDEGRRLRQLIPGSVEISGADTIESKEQKLRDFSQGDTRVLITKPKIGGWGLNWQHCHRVVFFPSHSYEQYYQAVRRCWRFGQTSPVTVDIITTEGGANALANLQRKAKRADMMFDALLKHMNDALGVRSGQEFETEMEVPAWLR